VERSLGATDLPFFARQSIRGVGTGMETTWFGTPWVCYNEEINTPGEQTERRGIGE
jgi:hypothetical protein